MGQTYSVTLELRIKDKDRLIDLINKTIDKFAKKHGLTSVEWNLAGRDRKNLDDLMKVLITDRGFEKLEQAKSIVYMSDFDACYSWEDVMLDMFQAMVPELKDKSHIIIVDDSDCIMATIKDGKYICNSSPLKNEEVEV